MLDTIFDELMEHRGSQIHVRSEHVQRYAELIAEIDPIVVVAWKLAEIVPHAKDDAVDMLKDSVEQASTLFVCPAFDDQPFAENHAHLTGITGDDFVLSHLVLYGCQLPDALKPRAQNPESPENPDPEEEPTEPAEPEQVTRLRRIQRLSKAFITNWKATSARSGPKRPAYEEALLQAIPDDAQSVMARPQLDWETQDKGLVITEIVASDQWLAKQLTGAASREESQHAWMWFFILLWRTYRNETSSVVTRAIVLLILADIMALRRELIMDGSGLRRFVTRYFVSALRSLPREGTNWKHVSQREAVRRLFAIAGDKAELKISVREYEETFTRVFAQIASQRIDALQGTGKPAASGNRIDAQSLDNWHFCLHLNRTSAKSRYERREALWEEARALKDMMGSTTVWNLAPPFDPAAGDPAYQRAPADFVRGLDVAGDETGWPITVFAPMLRWLRHQEPGKAPRQDRLVPPTALHLSVHAGEDYAHPLSGLRHVDETVQFCAMKQGDRLGHALALGIPPKEWLHRHGDVLVPLDEHVDNLVWAWQRAKELADKHRLQSARAVLLRLEQRIARFLPHVSWRPETAFAPPIAELYKAWELRRNCAYQALSQPNELLVGDSRLHVGVPDWSIISPELATPRNDIAGGLYVHWARSERSSLVKRRESEVMVRLTTQRHGHASRAQRRLEAALGADANSQMHDHDDDADMTFMLALQDDRIERYAQAGLSIEANPSSNVYIGQIETHSDHPIYRWNPPSLADLGKHNPFGLRKIAMPVTINTDDQGIVPTTLRFEFQLMHEGALDRGHDPALVDQWIENIRSLGLQHFDQVH
ncbi:Adenosine deaminase [Cupriavidus necator]